MILDTTFILDVMNGDERALERQIQLSESGESVRVGSPTIFELWTGIACSLYPETEKIKVATVLTQFDVINLNRISAEKSGEINGSLIKNGVKIDPEDAMIAGIAMLENETVLTRNVKHFSRINGLRIETY
jgi:tRNA(fMet)-specific endonuclease VapC